MPEYGNVSGTARLLTDTSVIDQKYAISSSDNLFAEGFEFIQVTLEAQQSKMFAVESKADGVVNAQSLPEAGSLTLGSSIALVGVGFLRRRKLSV